MKSATASPESAENLLKCAIRAAILAGTEILKIYDTEFSVEFKSDESPLTLADQKAHTCISGILSSTGIPIMSEEGELPSYKERKDYGRIWIVDPLDGTKEFIKKNGEFTVNIALIEQQKAVLGVIYQPVKRLLYFASVALGSFRYSPCKYSDPSPADLDRIISRAEQLPLAADNSCLRVVASRSHLGPETLAFLEKLKEAHPELSLISAGSSLKFCLLAEGSAHLYPRFGPTQEWDTAAGQAILECAGGEVIDNESQMPMLYNRELILNNSFLAKGNKNALAFLSPSILGK